MEQKEQPVDFTTVTDYFPVRLVTLCLSFIRRRVTSPCVIAEDEIAACDLPVAGKGCGKGSRLDARSVIKKGKPPSASRRVFSRVFDHQLHVRRFTGNK